MEELKKIIKKIDWTNLVPVLFVMALVMLILLSIVVGQMNAGMSSLEDFSNNLYDALDTYNW